MCLPTGISRSVQFGVEFTVVPSFASPKYRRPTLRSTDAAGYRKSMTKFPNNSRSNRSAIFSFIKVSASKGDMAFL